MTAPAAQPTSRLAAADVAVGCRIRHTATAASAVTFVIEQIDALPSTAFCGERVRFRGTAVSRNGVPYGVSVTVGVDEMVEVAEAENERG